MCIEATREQDRPTAKDIQNVPFPSAFWMIIAGVGQADIDLLCDRAGWLIPEHKMTLHQKLRMAHLQQVLGGK